MKKLFVFFLISVSLLFFSCAHINELAKYNLNGEGIFFENHVSADAARLQFIEKKSQDQNGNKKKNVVSVLASVGSDILSEASKSKIANAVSTDSVVSYVSEGLGYALVFYLNVKPVPEITSDPKFIAETTIEECQLVTGPSDVFIRIKAYARIVDRKSGKIVWDNIETETVPIRRNNSLSENNSTALKEVFSAVQLASLSTREIQNVINEAAKSAGRMMGETLRKDVVKSREE